MASRSAGRPEISTSTSVAPAAATVSSARFTTSLTAAISGWPVPKALRSTPMRACAMACVPAASSGENCAAAERALVPWSAITESSAAASATDRASGPIVSCRATSTSVPSCETTSGVVRIPTTLQKAAGTRTEPPQSVPSATVARFAATAAADPALDPPESRPGSYGFFVSPVSEEYENHPAAKSHSVVLPSTTAPAARSRRTTSASARAR